jgi:hypothetical protein
VVKCSTKASIIALVKRLGELLANYPTRSSASVAIAVAPRIAGLISIRRSKGSREVDLGLRSIKLYL